MNDNDWLKPFPTRTGTPMGSGMERALLNKVGGPNTIRTEIQNNPDGSTTMLRTRNGMPEFTTTDAPTPAAVTPLVWSFDYASVKSVSGTLVPATSSSALGTVCEYTGSGLTGYRVRRTGIEAAGAGVQIKAAESVYQYPLTATAAGPHYWYSGKKSVTWCSLFEGISSGNTHIITSAVVKHKETIIELVSPTYLSVDWNQRYAASYMLAACLVSDAAGVSYIRAAYRFGTGEIGGPAIKVVDYTLAGALVSSVTYKENQGAPGVSWFALRYAGGVEPLPAAWAKDGLTLAVEVNSATPNPILLLNVTRPTSGVPSVTGSMYSPASNPTDTILAVGFTATGVPSAVVRSITGDFNGGESTHTISAHVGASVVYSKSVSNNRVTTSVGDQWIGFKDTTDNGNVYLRVKLVAADFLASVFCVHSITSLSGVGTSRHYTWVNIGLGWWDAADNVPSEAAWAGSYTGALDLYINGTTTTTATSGSVPYAPNSYYFDRSAYGDWCQENKSLLAFTYGGTSVIGKMYKGGVWKDVLHNPSEPAPQYMSPSYPLPRNVSHY